MACPMIWDPGGQVDLQKGTFPQVSCTSTTFWSCWCSCSCSHSHSHSYSTSCSHSHFCFCFCHRYHYRSSYCFCFCSYFIAILILISNLINLLLASRLGHKRKEKTRSITCRTNRANEANKMFIIWLC